MSCPKHHDFLTRASNTVSDACALLEQASYDDPTYKPLHEAACRLHKRLFARWNKNVKLGNKKGWFK